MLMKKRNQRKNMAVAPVLATLLMIAVAVAMSVIIFMWSQGFLAQTSESTGSQQGSQNQAAQSSVAIEIASFGQTSVGNSTSLILRNVGAVSISIGTVSLQGLSSNVGFSGTVLVSVPVTGLLPAANATAFLPSSGVWGATSKTTALKDIAKGSSVVIHLGSTVSTGMDTLIKPGDVITIKVTTDKGTFAQQSFTIT